MATYFFDSSGLAKRYINETGTAWVRSITDSASGDRVYVARITLVEIVSAVVRRGRRGDITPGDMTIALADVHFDFTAFYDVIDVNSRLVNLATTLVERHALRAYDSVQLAAATQVNSAYVGNNLPPVTFVSADAALNTAATIEGLNVDDPNNHWLQAIGLACDAQMRFLNTVHELIAFHCHH